MHNAQLYHYEDCGVPNILLNGGVTAVETPHGPATAIENLDQLHHQIAMDIINSPSGMTGAEFRFLRIELDLSQTALSQVIKTPVKTIQRWEKERAKDVPGSAGVAIGAIYSAKHSDDEFRSLVERLCKLDREITEHQSREFKHTDDSWTPAA